VADRLADEGADDPLLEEPVEQARNGRVCGTVVVDDQLERLSRFFEVLDAGEQEIRTFVAEEND
jgi:hypothetical protein